MIPRPLIRVLAALCASIGAIGLCSLSARSDDPLEPASIVLGLIFVTALSAGLVVFFDKEN